MHRRPSSLCPASRYKTLVFSLPSLLRLRGGYPASALASGRAVLHAITFYMHRMLSSLYHNSSLGSFFSLPFHLRMRRGYPAQPWFQYKVLVFSLPFHLCMRGGYPASALAPGRSVLRAVLETGPTPTPFILLDACSMHQLKMPLWRSTAVHQTKKKQMACQMSFALWRMKSKALQCALREKMLKLKVSFECFLIFFDTDK
jgi:hypothetical protein